jgi:hypothetical protein
MKTYKTNVNCVKSPFNTRFIGLTANQGTGLKLIKCGLYCARVMLALATETMEDVMGGKNRWQQCHIKVTVFNAVSH